MSLADELLADLEDAGEAEEEQLLQEDEIEDVEDIAMEVDTSAKSVRSIAKLRDSEQLKQVMKEIAKRIESDRTEILGPVESDPEYQLIVEANNFAVEIDNEISKISNVLY